MANDSKNTPTSGAANANKPEPTPEAAKQPTDAASKPSGARATSAPAPGAASAKPPTPSPTPSSTASGASKSTTPPRPITSNPAYGDPIVDRLSLDPADSDDWVMRTKLWVEENPALAIVGAIGLGLLVGRIVTAAIPDPEPSLTDKIERRAKELSKQGRYYADDAGDAIGKQLAIAAEALGVAAQSVSHNAKHGFDEAKDFSEHIAEAIGDAFSKKASQWLDKIS
jgi:hypothetical protein